MDVTVLITGGCGEGFRGNPSPTGDPPQPSLKEGETHPSPPCLGREFCDGAFVGLPLVHRKS